MILRRKHKDTIPPSEKKQLALVHSRLDAVETRMGLVETQLRVIRRDAK